MTAILDVHLTEHHVELATDSVAGGEKVPLHCWTALSVLLLQNSYFQIVLQASKGLKI